MFPDYHSLLKSNLQFNKTIELTSLENIHKTKIVSNKENVVISCLSPDIVNKQYLYGDYIPFDLEVGCFEQAIIEKIVDENELQKRKIFLISPQPTPQNPRWSKDNFFYIELPEFYGVYWNFYKSFQPVAEPDNFSKVTKHYLCLSKRITASRLFITANLCFSNLIEKGIVSFLSEFPRGNFPNFDEYDKTINSIKHLFVPKYEKEIEFIRNNLPLQSTSLLDINDTTCVGGGWITDSQVFEKSFVNIITETYEDTPGSQVFTEKLFKTIYHRRPFFIMGSVNSLSALKGLGFRTFDKWFNETYDFEINPFSKTHMIMEQLKRICDLPIRDVKNMLKDMQEVLDYNYNHLQQMSQNLPNRIRKIDQWILRKASHR